MSAVVCGLGVIFSPDAATAQVVWNGSGDGSTWNDAANWSGGVLPGGTSIAQFGPTGGNTQIGLTTNLSIARINLTSDGISRVIGNASATPIILSLAGSGGILLENLSTTQTLTIASNVNGGSGGMSLALPSGTQAIHAAGNILISANLTGNAFSKTGAGVLTLTGTNTQSGFGSVTGGTLQIGDGGTTGTVGDMHLALSNGSIVSFNRSNTLTYTLDITGAGSVTQAGTGTTIFTGSGHNYNGGTTVSAGTLQLGNGGTSGTLGTGAVSIANGATLAVNRSNNYSLSSGNVISGAGTLQKTGAGVLTLNTNPNASFTGSVSILGGTLAVQSATGGTHSLSNAGSVTTSGTGTLSLTGGSAYTFANTITGTGGLSFNASAAVSLSGSNSYTGPTTIQNLSGALVVTNLANGGVNSSLGAASSDAANLVFNTSVLRYTGAGSSTDRLFSITGSGNAGFIDANGTGALQFTGTGAMGFNGQTGLRDLVLQGTSTADVQNSIAMLFSDNGGTTRILKRGVNTWLLTGTISTYTGATTIEGGVLGVAKLANGGTASSIGSSSSAATSIIMTNGGLLRYTGSGDTTNRLFSIGGGSPAGGGIESSGSGAVVFSNTGDIGTGGTTVLRTFTLGGSNTGENTLASRYTDMGSNNMLTKSGAGKWILTANNTNTGTTSITGGTLQLGTGGTSGALGSGTINFSNNSNLIVNRSDAVTMGQSIAGSGNFTQTGGGTTTLTNTNTYSGATTISSGTLQLGHGGTTGSIANTSSISNSGTLIINRSNAVTWSTPLSGSGGFTQAGAGTTTLAVSPTHTGPTTVNAGKLQSSVSITLPNSDFTIGASGTLATNGTTAWSIGSLNGSGTVENGAASGATTLTLNGSGTFTGLVRNGSTATLSIVKTGSGTQSLDGANTFTGPVSITGGTLSTNTLANGGSASGLGASSSLPANLLLDGGTLRYSGSAASTDRRFDLGANGGTLDASGSGAVNFTATNDLSFTAAPGTRTLTLTGTSTAANTLAAKIVDGTSATALIKDGPGTWLLTNNNTFTGGTTLSDGVLRISSSNAIGTGSLTFAGGSLEATQSMSIANSFVVNDANNGVTVSAGVLTLNGSISGSFPLYKDGPGTLIIASGSNSVPTVVQNGTVQGSAANAGTSIALNTPAAVFEFNQNTSGTYGGIISGQGGISVTGSGGLLLTGTNTFDGATQVSGGVLTVLNSLAFGSTAGGIAVQSGGTVELRDGVSIGTETIQLNGNGASGQSGALVSANGANTYAGSVVATTNASIAALPGSTLNLVGGLVKNGTVATLTGGGAITISGAGITGASPNSDLVVDGSGTVVTLNTTNSYNGPTFVQNSGTLVLGLSNALPTSPRTDLSLTTSGTFNLNSHSDAIAGLSGDATGTVRNSTTATTSTFEVAPTSTATFSGVIAGTNGGTQGDVNLSKTGSGTQVLDGANTYSGSTTISGGTLQIGSGGSSGQIGTGSITNNAELKLNRSDTITLNQVITGSGSVTQAGSGTTILTSNNNWSGGTAIQDGTLRLGNGGTDGSIGSGAITNDSTLEIKRSNSVTLSQAITGSGSLVQSGSGNTTLNGNSNTYSGGTTISSGTLLATNTSPSSSATGSGSVTVENGARLAGTGRITGDVTFQTSSKLLIGILSGDSNGRDFEFGGHLSSTGAFEARFDLFSNLGNGTLNSTLSADQFVVSGADRLIDLDIHLVLDNPHSLLNWAAGDSWAIWSWGSISGGNRQLSIASLTAPTLPPSLGWDTSQLNTTGQLLVVFVPEPSRAILLLLGLLALLQRRRRF